MSRTASLPSVRSCRSSGTTSSAAVSTGRSGVRWRSRWRTSSCADRPWTTPEASPRCSPRGIVRTSAMTTRSGSPATGCAGGGQRTSPRLRPTRGLLSAAMRSSLCAGSPGGRGRQPCRRVMCPSRGPRTGYRPRLLDEAEQWAEKGLPRFHVHVVNDRGRKLAMQRGHELVRFFWRMEIDMSEEPRVPERRRDDDPRLPPGGDDAALHAMHRRPSRTGVRRARSTSGWVGATRSDYHPEFCSKSPRRTARSPVRLCALAKTTLAGCSTSRSGRPRGGRGWGSCCSSPASSPSGRHACIPASGSRSTPRTRPARRALRARGHEGHAPLCDLREGARVARTTLSTEGP